MDASLLKRFPFGVMDPTGRYRSAAVVYKRGLSGRSVAERGSGFREGKDYRTIFKETSEV